MLQSLRGFARIRSSNFLPWLTRLLHAGGRPSSNPRGIALIANQLLSAATSCLHAGLDPASIFLATAGPEGGPRLRCGVTKGWPTRADPPSFSSGRCRWLAWTCIRCRGRRPTAWCRARRNCWSASCCSSCTNATCRCRFCADMPCRFPSCCPVSVAPSSPPAAGVSSVLETGFVVASGAKQSSAVPVWIAASRVVPRNDEGGDASIPARL